MTNEMMDKIMSEEELDQVVGGAKVFILAYLKNGKIDAFHGDYTGDEEALKTLIDGGEVQSLKMHFSGGHMQGIRKEHVQALVDKYRRNGYTIYKTREQ